MTVGNNFSEEESGTPENLSTQDEAESKFYQNVEDIMSLNVFTIKPESTLYEAAQLMGKERIGSLIVVKYDTPVGIITERDLLNVVSRGVKLEKDWIGGGVSIREEKVESVMSFPVVKICSDSPLKDVSGRPVPSRPYPPPPFPLRYPCPEGRPPAS